MHERILFAPAGWEQRYEEGVYIDIEEFKPTLVLVPFSKKYAARTSPFRERISARCKNIGIIFIEEQQDYYDAVSLYKSTLALFETCVSTPTKVRLNGTTSPRDLIWYALHFLSQKSISTEFSYFRPIEYGEYLSWDAREPRLIFKRSGIAYPDLPTCILALSGFDMERLAQLKQRYEPRKMLIGRQTGRQLGNEQRNVLANTHSEVEYFDFNCFEINKKALQVLCEKLAKIKDTHNIIAASLGPKPCAVILFQLTQVCPEIGLVYIPAGDYSEDYSSGIDLSQRTLNEVSWS